MVFKIRPSKISGRVMAPPSKSALHRLLISAGLSEGESVVRRAALSEDILASIDCLKAMGAEAEFEGAGEYKDIRIKGVNPFESLPSEMRCRESGSTLRFMIPVAALSGRDVRFSGSERLMQRPLNVYEDVFKCRGVTLARDVEGIMLSGRLSGGCYELDGSVSSQFVSGLLFALPLAEESSVISLIPPVSSRPYIDMTIDALQKFGVDVAWKDERTLEVSGRQKYSAADVTAEGDWSNAAFLIAMGADAEGLDSESPQGDKICIDCFKAIEEGCPEIDISDCPDLGPVLMAYAALHSGCTLKGTDRLAIKESDRRLAMKEELAKFGVELVVGDDFVKVTGGAGAPKEELYGHNDHRIVMALSLMGTRLGATIEGAEAVNKSFPNFASVARECGAEIEIIG